MKVYLDGNTLARLDYNEPFLLPINELELEFSSNVYKLNTLIVGVKKDGKIKQFKVKSPYKLDLKEFISTGAIDICISMTIHTTVVKEWILPTIYFREVEQTFEVTPEIAQLREEITKTKKAITELVQLLKNNNII
jgi:hypothetical protein